MWGGAGGPSWLRFIWFWFCLPAAGKVFVRQSVLSSSIFSSFSLSCISLLSLSHAFPFFLSLLHFSSFSLSCISLLSLSLAFLFRLLPFPSFSLSCISASSVCAYLSLFLALCVRACGRAVEEPSCRHTPKTLLLTSIFVLSFPVKNKSKRHFHTPKKSG